MKYINALKNGIEAMITIHNAFFIGEDIQDPYGGAFKVSKGLSSLYPKNIIGTPMSEQGFLGMGVGMAVEGSYVIVESMFGDFITLMCDQMINHAAKFYQMYGEPIHLVLRCPSGGNRGYGATHSQSLEKVYLGIPGIQVIAASIASDPSQLLRKALESGVPTLFVENKLDYPRELLAEEGEFWTKEAVNDNAFPINKITVKNEKPNYTIVTYGGMVSLAMEVMRYFLYEEEINIDVVVVANLNRVDMLAERINSSKVLILEEGVEPFGWSAEVAYALMKEGKCVCRCGARESYIPAAKGWEEFVLPNRERIIASIRKELVI